MSSVETFAPTASPAGEAADLSLFHRTLAQMCRANVPLPSALRLLSRDLERGSLRAAAARMAEDLEQGAHLAQAYSRQREQLPPLYRTLIEAGTASGDLPAVLDEIARHAAERAQIKARMRRALFYPLVSAIGVGVIGVGLLLFSIPMAGELAETANGDLIGLISAGRSTWWDLTPWAVLTLVCAGVVGALVFAWFRSPLDGASQPRGFSFRLPFCGYLRACAAKSGFASTLSLLIRRGMPLPEALTLAAEATEHPAVRQQVETMGAHAMNGANLAESVAAGELISPAMLWFVETGEQNHSPESGLTDVARIYRGRLDRGVDRLCAFAGPAALFAVGLIVLAFVAAVFGPMYSSFVNLFWL